MIRFQFKGSEAIEDLALRWASDPIRGQSELSVPALNIVKAR